MAGTAQGGRTPGDTGGCASGSHHRFRNRSNGRHPIRGAVARGAVSPVGVRDASEIEHAIATFGHGANGGLIVLGAPLAIMQRDLISTLATRHRLAAVYPVRLFVAAGGLISYGPDSIDPYRHVAGYVDRILKGEKPADLPVQNPTKFELVINLKTAKALGLDMPASVLARADEVIE